MDEPVSPCSDCGRDTCRCPDRTVNLPEPVDTVLDETQDWAPWSTGLAANA